MSADLLQSLLECGTPAKLVADVAMLAAELKQVREQLAGVLENNAAKREAVRTYEREKKRSQRGGLSRNVPGTHGDNQGHGAKEIPPNPHKKNTNPLNGSIEPIPQGGKPTRLPDDFEMPVDWIEWAMTKRNWSKAEATEEAECFCRYWQAKGGRDATKRSWRKTWENWVVNSRRQSAAKPAGPTNLSSLAEQATRYRDQRRHAA